MTPINWDVDAAARSSTLHPSVVSAQAAFESVPPTPVPPGGVKRDRKGRGKGSRSRSKGKGGKKGGKGKAPKGGGKASKPPFTGQFNRPATRIVKVQKPGRDAQKGAGRSGAP